MALVKRLQKGSPLTALEMDDNLTYLEGIVGAGTNGSAGTSGTTGSSGDDGSNGTSGTRGTSGTSGVSGTAGTTGTAGTSGINGQNGTNFGTAGTSGTSGTSGTNGFNGTNGTSGTSSSAGTTGTGGTSGTSASGTSGSTGTAGSSGTSGAGAALTVKSYNGTAFSAFTFTGVDTLAFSGSAIELADLGNGDVKVTINATTSTGGGGSLTFASASSTFTSISTVNIGSNLSLTNNATGQVTLNTRVAGTSGTSGAGTSGTSGINGFAGTSGISGTGGSAGTSGVSGANSLSVTGSVGGVGGVNAINFTGPGVTVRNRTGGWIDIDIITGSNSLPLVGIVSSSLQIEAFGFGPLSGSNQFKGNQGITGSLKVQGQFTASMMEGFTYVGGPDGITMMVSTASFSASAAGGSGNGFPYVGAANLSGSLVITGSLNVTGSISASAFYANTTGTPELASPSSIKLTAQAGVVQITTSSLRLASFSDAQTSSLTATNGDMIYNTTSNKFWGYAGGAWVALH